MNVRVQWYEGNGTHAGSERTTLDEITARLGQCLKTVHQSPRTKKQTLIAIARFASGEVARVHRTSEGQL